MIKLSRWTFSLILRLSNPEAFEDFFLCAPQAKIPESPLHPLVGLKKNHLASVLSMCLNLRCLTEYWTLYSYEIVKYRPTDVTLVDLEKLGKTKT
jgi:hypothetical protein